MQTEVCVGGRRDAGGGGGPVPALQAQAPHPGHYCPGEGVSTPGGAAVRPGWSSGGPGGGGPGLCGPGERGGDDSGCPPGGQRYPGGTDLRRRCGPEEAPAAVSETCYASIQGGGRGAKGQRLPPLLRLQVPGGQGPGVSDPGHQPGGRAS